MAQTMFWDSDSRRRSWPHEPARLEMLATRSGLADDELRAVLEREIQRRRRERGDAWERLDRTLEMRENGVASTGNAPEASPVHHQHRI
jgi:hypothetical protein